MSFARLSRSCDQTVRRTKPFSAGRIIPVYSICLNEQLLSYFDRLAACRSCTRFNLVYLPGSNHFALESRLCVLNFLVMLKY